MGLEPTEGAVVADRFRLVREIGRGGMGSVWLARQTALNVRCAVKFIHAEAAAQSALRSRFEREAKAAAQLHSPNVVHILDHGVWDGIPYIAMEYLDGEDLAKRLRRFKKLSPEATLAIAVPVARALTRAHAAGLVHRDLKPANIFLVRDDDREIVKVLDFGIAKAQAAPGEASTQTGVLLGTLEYMSPEQLRGSKEVDHRADVWSLAIVLFRCLTGELPFQAEALADWVMKIMVDPVPLPTQVAPGLPPALDAWWERAVRRSPAERFQTAKELVEGLALALGLTSSGEIGGPPSAVSAAGGAQPAAGVSQTTATCSNCGVVLPDGSSFCGGCGAARRTPAMDVLPYAAAAETLCLPPTERLPPGWGEPPNAPAEQLTADRTTTARGLISRSAASELARRYPRIVPILGAVAGALAVAAGLVLVLQGTLREASPAAPPASSSEPAQALAAPRTADPGAAPPQAVADANATAPPAEVRELDLEPSALSSPPGTGGQAKGELTFNTIPRSNFLLDGRPMGKTPKVGVVVSPGQHTVVFVYPDTGERRTKNITVVGGTVQHVTDRLEDEKQQAPESPSTGQATTPGPMAAPASRLPASAGSPARSSGTGGPLKKGSALDRW